MRLAGGAEAVTAKMRDLGIEGISVNRSTAYLISDWMGATLPPESDWTPAIFRSAFASVTPGQRAAADGRVNRDLRDTAQPAAMAALLEKIYARKILKPDTADLLLDIMSRCRTGEGRVKGILPPRQRWRTKQDRSAARSTMSVSSRCRMTQAISCWPCSSNRGRRKKPASAPSHRFRARITTIFLLPPRAENELAQIRPSVKTLQPESLRERRLASPLFNRSVFLKSLLTRCLRTSTLGDEINCLLGGAKSSSEGIGGLRLDNGVDRLALIIREPDV